MDLFQKRSRLFLAISVLMYHQIVYLLLNLFSQTRELFTISLFVDEMFPFIPEFTIIYLSAYILAISPYFLFPDVQEFRRVIFSYFISFTICYAVFLILPIEVVRPESPTVLLSFLHVVDLPYNAFPSIHVMISFLPAFLAYRKKKWLGGMFLIWAIVISLSTMFLKQHYFLDVVGGLLVAVIGYLIFINKYSE